LYVFTLGFGGLDIAAAAVNTAFPACELFWTNCGAFGRELVYRASFWRGAFAVLGVGLLSWKSLFGLRLLLLFLRTLFSRTPLFFLEYLTLTIIILQDKIKETCGTISTYSKFY
jgi:hypothetical protein